jgi:hypothetical protein
MEHRDLPGTHPSRSSGAPLTSVVRDDPWEMGFAPMFDVDSSTFPEDYRGPTAKITPIRPVTLRPSRRARLAAAVSRLVDYLEESFAQFPEHLD